MIFEDQEEGIVEIDRDLICHTLQGNRSSLKLSDRKKYVDSIREGMITFGLGPAGTGKHIWQWQWRLQHLNAMR